MPLTTTLQTCELDKSTGNGELDAALRAARDVTGENYQIVLRRAMVQARRFPFRRYKFVESPQLYVEVGGWPEWQVMQCAHDEATCFAYLFGVVNGAAIAKAKGEE